MAVSSEQEHLLHELRQANGEWRMPPLVNPTVGAWQLRTQHTFSRTPGLREQRALNKRRGWPGLHARPSQRAVITAPRLRQDGVKRGVSTPFAHK